MRKKKKPSTPKLTFKDTIPLIVALIPMLPDLAKFLFSILFS